MNKTILHVFSCTIPFTISWAQDTGKFDLSINYGLNGNFFVNDYDESGPGILFYEKDFIGTSGGAELKYRLAKFTYRFLKSKNN